MMINANNNTCFETRKYVLALAGDIKTTDSFLNREAVSSY